MNTYDFSVVIKSQTNFDQTVAKAFDLIEANNFKILHIRDVKAIVANKGIGHLCYKLIEFCRTPVSKKVLRIDSLAGIFLSRKIAVFKSEGKTTVAAMRPHVIAHFFNNIAFHILVSEIDADIKHFVSFFSPSR